MQRVVGLMTAWPVYVIALVFSMIATILLSLSSKGKVTTTSRTYEKEGSFVLSGSSGRSHGGGGGRF